MASPFSLDSNVNSIPYLKNLHLRFYTEPDSMWWQKNRQTKYENTNAARIIALTEQLQQNDWSKLELVQSKSKGYRSNGKRHPHSWSIVDVNGLMNWMNE